MAKKTDTAEEKPTPTADTKLIGWRIDPSTNYFVLVEMNWDSKLNVMVSTSERNLGTSSKEDVVTQFKIMALDTGLVF